MKIKDIDGVGRIAAGLLMLGAALLMTGFLS